MKKFIGFKVYGGELSPVLAPVYEDIPAPSGGLARDPICRNCATQEHGSPRLPEECRCGDYPAVPNGLEALVERSVWLTTGTLESLFRDGSHVAVQTLVHRVPTKSGNCEQYVPVRASLCVDEGCPHHGTPHVCNPNEPFWGEPEHERQRMLDAIAALIAERDEAKRERDELRAADRDHAAARAGFEKRHTERAETAERDLSAALNRIAEIEGETREACAKIAEAEAKAVDGRNADRYWQSKRIAAAIRSSATKQEKADV